MTSWLDGTQLIEFSDLEQLSFARPLRNIPGSEGFIMTPTPSSPSSQPGFGIANVQNFRD